jgi:hypothetical protein
MARAVLGGLGGPFKGLFDFSSAWTSAREPQGHECLIKAGLDFTRGRARGSSLGGPALSAASRPADRAVAILALRALPPRPQGAGPGTTSRARMAEKERLS